MGPTETILAGVAVSLFSVAGTWVLKDYLAARKARSKKEHSDELVTRQDCGDCQKEWLEAFGMGDEQLDILARGMAFILRWLPKLCEESQRADCVEMEKEAHTLADELLMAGKHRVRPEPRKAEAHGA